MSPTRGTLVTFLTDLERDPERPAAALRTPYRTFVWRAGEIRAAAMALGERLVALGVSAGDRVLLQGPNSPEWVAAFFGIVACGGVVVPLDEIAQGDFARHVASTVSARGAVVAAEHASRLEGAVPRIVTFESVERLRHSPGPFRAPYLAGPDETAEIVFTSGTTAEPKGVELSHANLLAALAGIEAGFRRREHYLRFFVPFRILCLVPLSHLFGQSLGITIPILMRSTALYASTLRPTRLIEGIRRDHPLAIVAVPRTLASLREALLRELDRRGVRRRFDSSLEKGRDRSVLRRILATRDVRSVLSWRTWVFVVGGAALDVELELFWKNCGFAVVQGYGMTEAAPIISIHNPLDGTIGTLGRAISGHEVRLAEDGEILVRGPNVMKGYYADPSSTGETIQDGWLRTGDLAERDEAGRLYFRGRKKDLIVTASGMNVFPQDVERVLTALDGVEEAVVFGLPGPGGEEVHAAVLTSRTAQDVEVLCADANARLLPYQRVRSLTRWDEADFPRTATGKVRRGEVRDLVRAERAQGAGGRPASRSEGARPSRIAAVLAKLRPELGSGIDPRARLGEDLGLESLEIVELLSLIEEEHDVSMDERRIGASPTVADLETLLEAVPVTTTSLRMPRWTWSAASRLARGILRFSLVRPLFALFVRLEVVGREHLRGVSGPLLFVSNHTSVLDTPAVLFSLPPKLRRRLAPAMAIESLPEHFDPEGQPLLRRVRSGVLYRLAVLLFGAYPLPQSRGYRPSLEYTGELLDAGLCPLVFPEGAMSRSGTMAPFKPGIGLLAVETRATILPVHLDGLARILPPEGRWPRRGRARVRFGAPFSPSAGLPSDPASVAARVERAVADLDVRSVS